MEAAHRKFCLGEPVHELGNLTEYVLDPGVWAQETQRKLNEKNLRVDRKYCASNHIKRTKVQPAKGNSRGKGKGYRYADVESTWRDMVSRPTRLRRKEKRQRRGISGGRTHGNSQGPEVGGRSVQQHLNLTAELRGTETGQVRPKGEKTSRAHNKQRRDY